MNRQEYFKKYYEEHKKELSEKKAEYYKRNPEKYKASHARWMQENREKWNAYMRERRRKAKLDSEKDI